MRAARYNNMKLLALLIALVSVPAYGEIVVGVGRAQLARPDNCCHWSHEAFGGWDMTEYDYTPMWSLGLRFQMTERIGIETRYHDWGNYSQFLGFYPDDGPYIRGEVIEPCTDCLATEWGYNVGTSRGITVTGTYEQPLFWKLALMFRAGAALVQTKWNSYRVIGPDPHQRNFDRIFHFKTNSLTGTAGVGLSYGVMRLEYMYVHDVETKPKVCCSPHQEVRGVELSFRVPW